MSGCKTVLPSPRSFFCASYVAGRLFVLGGSNLPIPEHSQPGKELLAEVEIFDPSNDEWLEATTSGPHTPYLYSAACASVDKFLYVYGDHGIRNHGVVYGGLHRLDTTTLTWTLLAEYRTNEPWKNRWSHMVAYSDSLVVFGGNGHAFSIVPQLHAVDYANELRLFDLKAGDLR